ncbi:phage tail protein [Georgenia ruanii]|uniref:Phage tail protein n=1 Tax=Georgenia ruanii TaxID=348442 RepID=A0A7J9UTV4_9MICO|nr:phage tail protein [Georgenia ruanii]MPV87300.1 phage tail protein [Georgenia ruanii]
MRPQWLVSQLPPGMLTDDFFTRFVAIFQAQADTLLAHAENLPHLADPTITPPAMLRWLGEWIGLDGVDAAMPEQVQRRLVAGAARILARRGTAAGLQEFLELFSGGPATVTDGGGVWAEGEAPADTAWVVMKVTSTGVLEEADFVALVQDEVPAHVRAELWVGSRRVWPGDGDRPVAVAVAVAAPSEELRPYGEEQR